MKKILLTTAAALALANPAFAAKLKTAPTESGDFKKGDILVRARILDVSPNEDVHVSNSDKAGISNGVTPELDVSYFFTPNIAVEAIAAVTQHNVRTSSGIDAGKAWLLPPTVTLQYHFNDFSWVKPYVGAGVNYTHFYNTNGGALNQAEYDDSFGGALQAGADFPLSGNWYANVDVKRLWISTDVTFKPSGVTAKADIDPWIIGAGVGYRF